MHPTPLTDAPEKEPRRWRRLVLAAAAVAMGAAPLALAASGAGRGDATPTAPPPLTILTHGTSLGGGDYFITPTGDTGTYANGPEIVNSSGEVIWFHAIPAGQTAADFRTQTYHGQTGTDLVAGHRLRRAVQRHRLHLQHPLPADRHGQRRQR